MIFIKLMSRWTKFLIPVLFSILATITISPFSILPSANADSIGEIQVWTGSSTSLPDDFLLADGSAVSRTTYSDLFTVIGTTFGAGDGSTTFNIPDLVETFLRGATDDAGRGDTGGESTHALTEAELAVHDHAITDPGHTHSGKSADTNQLAQFGGAYAGAVISQNTASSTTGITIDNAGSGDAHENKPPYLDIHYIIRYDESSSGSQSQIDTNTTNIASLNSTVIQLTSDITTLQSQITSMNATINTLDSEVSVIDTLVNYIDTFLDGIFLNYDP